MSEFSEKLQNLLKANKITQRKLAEDLSLTTASVSRYCSGEQFPRQNTLQKIAEYFSVSVSALLDGADSQSNGAVSDKAAEIISLMPSLKIKELESVKSYADYLIHQKLYTEDIPKIK